MVDDGTANSLKKALHIVERVVTCASLAVIAVSLFKIAGKGEGRATGLDTVYTY